MASIYHLKNIAFQALFCTPAPFLPNHLEIPEHLGCTLTDLEIIENITQDLSR